MSIEKLVEEIEVLERQLREKKQLLERARRAGQK